MHIKVRIIYYYEGELFLALLAARCGWFSLQILSLMAQKKKMNPDNNNNLMELQMGEISLPALQSIIQFVIEKIST